MHKFLVFALLVLSFASAFLLHPTAALAEGYLTLSGLYDDCTANGNREAFRKLERCKNYLTPTLREILKSYRESHNGIICGNDNLLDQGKMWADNSVWLRPSQSDFHGWSYQDAMKNAYVKYWDYKGVGVINGNTTTARASIEQFFVDRRVALCNAVDTIASTIQEGRRR